MAQIEQGVTWFDGLTWVDVPVQSTVKTVDVEYEMKLGLLMVFPIEVIYDILSRLPIEELIRYQIVCKSWYRLTKDPHFINSQVSKAIRRPRSYLLQENSFYLGDSLFLVDNGNDKWTSKEIQTKNFYGCKRPIHIHDSCNGLLCITLMGHEDPIIYNPITKDHITLPESDLDPRKKFHAVAMSYGFGFDWTNKKYKVVRVFNIYPYGEAPSPVYTKGEIITLGEGKWRPLDLPYKVLHRGPLQTVFSNGAFHWWIHREKDCSELDYIFAMDVMNEKFQTIKFPPHVKLPEEELDLINLGEALAIVNNSRFDKDRLQVWQIVGNRASGGRLCHYSFDVSVIDEKFNRGIELMGMLGNGDFLYTTLQTGEFDYCMGDFCNHLFRFNPRNSHGFSLEIPGIPRCFKSSPFTPTLASPGTFP